MVTVWFASLVMSLAALLNAATYRMHITRPTTDRIAPASASPLLVAWPARPRAKPISEKTSPRITNGHATTPTSGMTENSRPIRPSTKPAVPKPFLGCSTGNCGGATGADGNDMATFSHGEPAPIAGWLIPSSYFVVAALTYVQQLSRGQGAGAGS